MGAGEQLPQCNNVPVPAIRVYLSTHLDTAFTLNRNLGLFEQLGEPNIYLRLMAPDSIEGCRIEYERTLLGSFCKSATRSALPQNAAKVFESSV